MEKRTKIVATIGPSSHEVATLQKMISAGMNVARLNFSHGTHEDHKELVQNIRAAADAEGKVVAIMQDLQGPKIRVGELPEEGIELKEGERIIFDTASETYADGIIPVTYKELHSHVAAGERLLLNDGRVETMVTAVEGTQIHVDIKNTGTITSHKGINIPDSGLTISALTEKDKEDAQFGIELGVDIIAFSFVTSAQDVQELHDLIKEHDSSESRILVIPKIERAAALEKLDEIIAIADGIMVARGDLGIETPAASVPTTQKTIIKKCLQAAKPVIVATQMLDSMTDSPRPTRAEVSDVANAVIDHTDAVMLSNETATGKYPVEVVKTMASIIKETEETGFDDLELPRHTGEPKSTNDAISEVSRILAEDVGAKCILATSMTGSTGRLISHYRPEFPIYVGTNSKRVQAQLQLSWSVHPFLMPSCSTTDELRNKSVQYIIERKFVEPGDKIILVTGGSVGDPGAINKLSVTTVS